MKEAIKTFACVGAYAAGVVIGVTVATKAVTAIEKRRFIKKVEKAVKEGEAAQSALDDLDRRAAIATTFGSAGLDFLNVTAMSRR